MCVCVCVCVRCGEGNWLLCVCVCVCVCVCASACCRGCAVEEVGDLGWGGFCVVCVCLGGGGGCVRLWRSWSAGALRAGRGGGGRAGGGRGRAPGGGAPPVFDSGGHGLLTLQPQPRQVLIHSASRLENEFLYTNGFS